MEMIIDTREGALIQGLKNEGFNAFIVKQLDLGDIVFIRDDQEVYLIIERKTMKDLEASNKDGRYREQRARLIENYVKKGIKVMYLIEDFNSNNTALSMVVNLIIRDNIMVYHTKGLQETIKFLIKLKEKFNEHPVEILFGGSERTDYLSQLKLKKKENKNPDNAFILQLCQIPGVNIKNAEAIKDKYNNIFSLCEAYNKQQGEIEKELLLENILVSPKRKLGKILSTNIYKFMVGTG